MNDHIIDVVNVQEEGKYDFLLDPSYPLLKMLREKAPGTYKHSQSVEAMVEGVSLDLGLNVVELRIAALYHDIGKIFNPIYFCENTLDDEDPHKDLDPWISSQIITRHVSDSVNVLINDHNFPRHIIEIISQHHGNSVVPFFFKASGRKDCDSFRYNCTNPSSVESALLIICDRVEASSRARYRTGQLDPKELIENTIANLIDDGQLDNVTIKLGDLKLIKISLAKELQGSYQKRVEYPEEEKIKKEKEVLDD